VNQLIITVFSKFSSTFSVSNIWDIQRFFSQVIMTAILTGFIFQMPLVLSGMIRFKLISRKYLVSKRPYVYAVLLIIAVLLPPTDILSLIILMVPLVLLFEVALLINIKQP
jgi:sec-independent protein translocase protein TatC